MQYGFDEGAEEHVAEEQHAAHQRGGYGEFEFCGPVPHAADDHHEFNEAAAQRNARGAHGGDGVVDEFAWHQDEQSELDEHAVRLSLVSRVAVRRSPRLAEALRRGARRAPHSRSGLAGARGAHETLALAVHGVGVSIIHISAGGRHAGDRPRRVALGDFFGGGT